MFGRLARSHDSFAAVHAGIRAMQKCSDNGGITFPVRQSDNGASSGTILSNAYMPGPAHLSRAYSAPAPAGPAIHDVLGALMSNAKHHAFNAQYPHALAAAAAGRISSSGAFNTDMSMSGIPQHPPGLPRHASNAIPRTIPGRCNAAPHAGEVSTVQCHCWPSSTCMCVSDCPTPAVYDMADSKDTHDRHV